MAEANPAQLSLAKGLGGRELIIIAVMNLAWGLNHVAVKEAVDLMSPLTAAFLRQAIVMTLCLPWLRIMPGRMGALLTLGLCSGGLFYIVTNLSLAVTSNIGALAIAAQLSIPLALILAVLFLGERIGLVRMTAIAFAFAGVILLVFDPGAAGETLGFALTAVASLLWAICTLIQRKLSGVPVLTIYAWVGLVGSFCLLPTALVFEPDAIAALPTIPLLGWGWVFFSAAVSTLVGQGAMSFLIQRLPVSTVVPLTLPTPVVAVIAASLWLGTPITPVMILAGFMVLGGVAVVAIRTAQAEQANERV